MSLYDIWGGVSINLPLDDVDAAKAALGDTIQEISQLCAIASLWTGASLRWYPARYSQIKVKPTTPPPAEEIRMEWQCWPLYGQPGETFINIVNDQDVSDELLPLFEQITSIRSAELSGVLARALSFHAQGNYREAGLNRYVSLWAAIELLGHFFHSGLPGRIDRTQKKEKIMRIMEGVNENNCLQKVHEAAKIQHPGTRQILEAVLPRISKGELNAGKLFEENPKSGKSLYDIRNDLAHGKHAGYEAEFTEVVTQSIEELRQFSRGTILAVLRNANELSANLKEEKSTA